MIVARSAGRALLGASLAVATAAVSQAGCGGGGATPIHPGAGATHAGSSAENPEATADGQAPSTPADPCADGSCIRCGEGICPTGYYCDESAAGGPGCAWLASCAEQASCECVQRAVGGGCSCSERAGFAVLRCE